MNTDTLTRDAFREAWDRYPDARDGLTFFWASSGLGAAPKCKNTPVHVQEWLDKLDKAIIISGGK